MGRWSSSIRRTSLRPSLRLSDVAPSRLVVLTHGHFDHLGAVGGPARCDRRACSRRTNPTRSIMTSRSGSGAALFGFDTAAPAPTRLLTDGERVLGRGGPVPRASHAGSHARRDLPPRHGSRWRGPPVLGRHALRRQRGKDRLPGRGRARTSPLDRDASWRPWMSRRRYIRATARTRRSDARRRSTSSGRVGRGDGFVDVQSQQPSPSTDHSPHRTLVAHPMEAPSR